MTYTLPAYDLAQRFRREVPYYYGWRSTNRKLLWAILSEVALLREAMQAVLSNASPATSDLWSLNDDWDPEVGLVPDPMLALEQRQERVMARFNNTAPVTLPAIERFIAQYQYGTVSLDWDAPAAVLTVTFIDTRGVPPGLDDLQTALRLYLPAWIGLDWVFRYTIWSEGTASGVRWAQLRNKGITWAQIQTMQPSDLQALAESGQYNNLALTLAEPGPPLT